jgi:hypothetical protein
VYYEGTVASDLYKLETPEAERRANLKWRTRHLKTRESQVFAAIATNVLRLFVR